jgi:hypothetical protein
MQLVQGKGSFKFVVGTGRGLVEKKFRAVDAASGREDRLDGCIYCRFVVVVVTTVSLG